MNENVKVHLKQAILVGYGEEARYSKVLVGKRETTADYLHHATVFQAFTIIGFVHGYQGYNLDEPARVYLADSNILAIETVKVERANACCGPAVSPKTPRQTKLCNLHRPHVPHTYTGGAVTLIHCPGKGY